MAAAGDIDTIELECTIKGFLFSRPTVLKANVLQRECEQELGKTFPYRQLGFPTFVDYLRSIPAVVQLEPHNGFNPDVLPVSSKASSHIDQLVSKQRVPSSKKRGGARRGGYNSRPAAVRRRPARPMVTRPAPPAVRPKQGVDVRDLEGFMRRNYNQRDLERNGIHNVDNLLAHAEGMMERGDTKVYPKLAGGPGNSDRSSAVKCIPAGLEDDFDDFDDEYEMYEEEEEKDSEEELSKEAIQLWSRALGAEKNASASRTTVPEDATPAVNSVKRESHQNVDLPEDDSNISTAMINNFRKILSQNPDGIWASQLQQLYFDQFRATLDFMDLGHRSAISLASSLPSVFTYHREGTDDWKLYDARDVTQEYLDTLLNSGDNLMSEDGRYIPQTIIENIKRLLEENNNGFRSTDLLQLYQETFRKPLDLEVLGFNTLEEFLMILKNDVTLKKVFNYYLLLPKHRLVSHDAMQPPNPDERLNVPVEALCVPVPDNMMRLGDAIPLQELPPVEMDLDPNKPLLELEVRVAEIISPVFFYIILGSTYEELEKMMDDLDKFYNWEEANLMIPWPHITMNLYCAAKYGNYWHRAKVTRIKSNGSIEIEYIDYGTPGTVKSSELRYLSKEFADLPAQAICAKLIGLKPVNGETKFPDYVCGEFLKIVEDKRLVAHVYQVAVRERMQLEVILFDVGNPNQEIVINDYLVEKGLASPICQVEDSSSEVQQPVGDLLSESDVTSLQANNTPPLSLPSCSIPLQGSDPPSLGNASTSLSASWRRQEENKPTRGPPPGFQNCDFDLLTPPLSATSTHSSSSQPANSMSKEEQQQIQINNIYLMDPAVQMLTKIMMQQEHFQQQNAFLPNSSNMPLGGPPVYQTQRSLTYGSVIPPQNAYHYPYPNMRRQPEYPSVPPAPSNYIQINTPVPGPVAPTFVLMNPPVPNQYLGFYPPSMPNMAGTTSAQVQGYGQGDYMTVPPLVQPVLYQQSPLPAKSTPTFHSTKFISSSPPKSTPTPPGMNFPPTLPSTKSTPTFPSTKSTPTPPSTMSTPTPPSPNFTYSPPSLFTPHPVSSSAPLYTPVTAPEWLPKNLPAPFTNSLVNTKIDSRSHHSVLDSQKKSESPVVNQVSRPCTPLTPASAEVANICKLSRSNSSASQDNTSSNSQTYQNLTNDLQGEKIEHDSKNDLDMSTERKSCPQSNAEVEEIPLPPNMDIKETPLPPPSPEKLHSAISSPVDSSVRTSPLKEESSDDYVSASENVEQLTRQLSNLSLTDKDFTLSLKRCDTVEDIPDSWENLDLDDTPAKASNFSVDFSQPLDVILKNVENKSSLEAKDPVEKTDSKVESEELPLKIQVPDNWKDIFNPSVISDSERVDNNNTVKENSAGPAKFNVKKAPVQLVEVQKKKFHLLCVNDKPAVVALEFFSLFAVNSNPFVSEKVVEVSCNLMYYISKSDYPAILDELNKVTQFCDSLNKKTVVRFNKVRILNLSDIPLCMKYLNTPNKPLLDDLKIIANELESC